jgi:hypothetical protein
MTTQTNSRRWALSAIATATTLGLWLLLPHISATVAQVSGSQITTSTTAPITTSTTINTQATSGGGTVTPAVTTNTVVPSLPSVLPGVAGTTIPFQLVPNVGTIGTPVQATGVGPPLSTLSFVFNSLPVPLGAVSTDAGGNFGFTFTVPPTADPGQHTVTASGPSGQTGAAPFTVLPGGAVPYGPPPVVPAAVPTAAAPTAAPGASTTPAAATTTAGGTPTAFTGRNVAGLSLLAAAVLGLGALAFGTSHIELNGGWALPLALPWRRRRVHARRRRDGVRRHQIDATAFVQVASCIALAVTVVWSLARIF